MNHTNIRSRVIASAALAVCLWVAAGEAAHAQSIIAPLGEQFFSWTETFQADFYPFLVSIGLLIAIGVGFLISIKAGGLLFAGVVAGAVAWGLRIGIIGLGA